MSNSHETDIGISFDIDLGDLDKESVSIDVVVEEEKEKDFVRLKNNRVKKVADFFGSKAKAIKDADLFKSIETLQKDNPDYWFLYYTNECQRRNVKKRHKKTIWIPYRQYYFYSNNSDINYFAETVEQKTQVFIVEQNGKPVSEIREVNPTEFSVTLNGFKLGNLIKTNKGKGWTTYTCGNVLIREKWTGYIEITTTNGVPIALILKTGIRQVLKSSKDVDLTTVVSIILAVNAYHNAQRRLSNPDAPYEVIYHDTSGDG